MNLILNKIRATLSNVLEFVAALNVKPASCGYVYQPKAPKCLNEKR